MTYPIEKFHFRETGTNSLSGIRHTHNESCEILQVLHGSGTMMIKNRLYPIKPNAVFLVGKMELHSAVPDSDNYTRNILNISDRYLDNILTLSESSGTVKELFERQCVFLNDDVQEALNTRFEDIALMEYKQSTGLGFLQAITGILYLLMETDTQQAESLHNSVSDAIRYMNANMDRLLTLDEICDYIHLSKYHFCRLFRKSTNMSPFCYIVERRISKAKKLLLYTTLSISEIAEKTGFGSFSAFSNAFLKKEGVAPREFRRKTKSGNSRDV